MARLSRVSKDYYQLIIIISSMLSSAWEAENRATKTFLIEQDKYTIYPGRQIYLSSNKKIFDQKNFLNNKIKNNLRKRKIFQKKFLKKNFSFEKKSENFWK